MRFRRRDDRPVTLEDLSAFADGRLPAGRAARVARYLRAHPDDADRIHAYWRREAALYRAFEPALGERDLGAWEHRLRPAGKAHRRLAYAACAAALALAVALAGSWLLDRPERGSSHFATVALDAYAEPAAVAEADHSVSLEFAALDLEPLGRRHMSFGHEEVTEYRYRRGEGRPIALYASESTEPVGDGLFRVFQRDDTRLVEWTAAGKRYAVVGERSASELIHLAVQLRSTLIAPPSAIAELPQGGPAGVDSAEAVRDLQRGDPPPNERRLQESLDPPRTVAPALW